MTGLETHPTLASIRLAALREHAERRTRHTHNHAVEPRVSRAARVTRAVPLRLRRALRV